MLEVIGFMFLMLWFFSTGEPATGYAIASGVFFLAGQVNRLTKEIKQRGRIE